MIKIVISQLEVFKQTIEKYYALISNYMAGVEGLEPTAPGFGDRCSTN